MPTRRPSTTRRGTDFSDEMTLRIWRKAQEIWGYDPDEWREDKYGRRIQFSAYGDRRREYGWEIDHSKPVAKGGTDHINNLQPLHWRENVMKGNLYRYPRSRRDRVWAARAKRLAERRARKRRKALVRYKG